MKVTPTLRYKDGIYYRRDFHTGAWIRWLEKNSFLPLLGIYFVAVMTLVLALIY